MMLDESTASRSDAVEQGASDSVASKSLKQVLPEFEAFLTFSENNLQDLQFLVWFQDYAARFFALSEERQKCSPGPSKEVLLGKCRFLALFHVPRVHLEATSPTASTITDEKLELGQSQDKSASPSPTPRPHRCRFIRMRSMSDASMNTVTVDDTCDPACNCRQPFREECMHVMHTFFRPKATKAVVIDHDLRHRMVSRAAHSTHPDVFADIYDHVYRRMENGSLANFIVLASTNMSVRKQMILDYSGAALVLISFAIALSTILAIPDHRFADRAWRTFAIPFWLMGSNVMYATFSGICPYTVFHGGGAQLHAWELEEADDQTRACIRGGGVIHVSLPPLPPSVASFSMSAAAGPVPSAKVSTSTSASSAQSLHTSHASTSTLASFTPSDIFRDGKYPAPPPPVPPLPAAYVTSSPARTVEPLSPAQQIRIDLQAPSPENTLSPRSPQTQFNAASAGFRRRPIFGPHRVVQDQRIRAVHYSTVIQSVLASFLSTLVFCSVLYTVPGLHH
ncbi:hypothetical protein EXIGLDRAFT_840062 [Exidia glandulosa HHB12029]|uniref:Uncharacterized protein n=1 Tax=Exidia glandulosa HHB12029 TaxID=1314781 RepID=A0A165ENV3_EXIGL|nr:hypothetical protein EXIGLDRAFT_840062 [Exidia glandulosa HHB12029]